ncbi:hypothetical protein GDO81_028150, partial [Engystomops pustulosus]
QVKKLLVKVLLKESCYYRKLTDTSTDDGSHEELDALQEDILGNRLLLPSKAARCGTSAVEEKSGLIVYKGAMVDIGSLLQKLEKSEKARAELEQRLQTLQSKTGTGIGTGAVQVPKNKILVRLVHDLAFFLFFRFYFYSPISKIYNFFLNFYK